MDDISTSLIKGMHEVTMFSSRLLEMTGLEKPFHAAADTLFDYPINTLLMSSYFITLMHKIRTSDGIYFASSNPFGSLLSSVILCFAGSTLQNILLGSSPVKAFQTPSLILLTCLIWYLTFFSPLDLFTRLVTFPPIRVILITVKEVYRVKCIHAGIQSAVAIFPGAWFIIIAIGCARGCGSLLLRPYVYQIVGLGTTDVEFHKPSFTTKLVILTSCFYAMQVNKIVDVSLASSSLVFTVVFATFQVLFLYTSQGDPFAPVENALARIFLRYPEERASSSAKENKTKSD